MKFMIAGGGGQMLSVGKCWRHKNDVVKVVKLV
jgi:hypothetical protein